MRHLRLGDRLWTAAVYVSGMLIIGVVLAIFYYLAGESRFAFDRKFDVGFRLALQPAKGEYEADVSLDPNATLVTLNREGSEGLDEKEETLPLPTLESLVGIASFATGSPLTGELDKVDPEQLYRDDWRPKKMGSEETRFLVYGFATPEYKEPTMALAWDKDQGFVIEETPYALTLELLRAPEGVEVKPFKVDLKTQPKGRLEIPTFIARTDADRTQGYVFELVASPRSSHVQAVIGGMASSSWEPTGAYQRYGFLPLILATVGLATFAILLAAPIALGTAVYISEMSSSRFREWAKPLIELLASVPTVVLGFFGLILVAPAVSNTIAKALGAESGRSFITAGIILAVLLIPVLTSLIEDSLRNVPQSLRDGGDALGMSKAEVVRSIIVPAAKSGIIGAHVLAIARAIGETMIVWILSGGTPSMPSFLNVREALANLVKPVKGIPDTVAIEMGNVDFEGVHYGHLFTLGLLLFLITMALSLYANQLMRRSTWRR